MNAGEVDQGGRFWRIGKWFPNLNPQTLSALHSYQKELIYFNERLNLISPRTEKTADLVHFADGILGSQSVLERTKSKEIYDIGSGNGVPGIILALLDTTRKIILVESDSRKIEFLRHCVAKIGLVNCHTLNGRLEDLPAGTIKCAVARGFASISKTLLYSRKPAALHCEFFHFKGPSWSSEIAAIPSQVIATWEPVHACDYPLPMGEAVMSIVLTKKVRE